MDTSHDGTISFEELERVVKEKEVLKWMAALDLSGVEDVGMLFSLLDKDHTGDISKNELVKGLAGLKGNARSIDVKILHQKVLALQATVDELARATAERHPFEES